MNLKLDEILKEASALPVIPSSETKIYIEKTSILKKYVDEALKSNKTINDLIGNNPLQLMHDNHTHHSAFMGTVFSVGNYELLVNTIVWAYRAYSSRNFSYDYFPLELKSWIEALEKHTEVNTTANIKLVYSWMIKRHDDFVLLSQILPEMENTTEPKLIDKKNSFLAALIVGNHRKCLEIAKNIVSTGNDIERFYLHIIQPAMYEIGILWERGTISVAQEHLASAIVSRVMATTSMLSVVEQQNKGKAVIACSPNEFHEIGAWMMSDILEHDGWNIRYLGANTPINDLIELLRSFKPDVFALSVTMSFNIIKATEIISKIKDDKEIGNTRVIIGGQAFNRAAQLWKATGADHFAKNILDAKQLLKITK